MMILYPCPSCDNGKIKMADREIRCSDCQGTGKMTDIEIRIKLGRDTAEKYFKKNDMEVVDDGRD